LLFIAKTIAFNTYFFLIRKKTNRKTTLIPLMKKAATILLFAVLLATTTNLRAQNAIQLTNTKTGRKQKPILTGKKVIYTLKPVAGKPLPKKIGGILSDVTDTSAIVNGVTVNLSELASFGESNSKAILGSGVLSGIGLALIRIGNAEPQQIPVNCAGCAPVTIGEERSKGSRIALTSIGFGFNVLSLANLLRNHTRDLTKWNLKTIDVEVEN
jgi:hypothetical protein